jgi:hypothetical protein
LNFLQVELSDWLLQLAQSFPAVITGLERHSRVSPYVRVLLRIRKSRLNPFKSPFVDLPIPENQRGELGFAALIVGPKLGRLLDFVPPEDDKRWIFSG